MKASIISVALLAAVAQAAAIPSMQTQQAVLDSRINSAEAAPLQLQPQKRQSNIASFQNVAVQEALRAQTAAIVASTVQPATPNHPSEVHERQEEAIVAAVAAMDANELEHRQDEAVTAEIVTADEEVRDQAAASAVQPHPQSQQQSQQQPHQQPQPAERQIGMAAQEATQDAERAQVAAVQVTAQQQAAVAAASAASSRVGIIA